MIKAVSGGGGKGMRAVFEESKFIESLHSCRREAMKSFSDDAVLIERLVRAPRHVELQVFGDKHGQVVHLRERDCSVQRRNQKVLEEAPAPNLRDDVRKAMGDAAKACAAAVNYVGAGTVEFLVDSISQEFYFCEMNTRLQVEHPVTEMITGLDLVEWQLRVASGQPLPLSQDEILSRVKGCAIEARIYAENPLNDFLPQTGYVGHMKTPVGLEDGIRADYGIRSGDSISTFYDPMIAKLIAYDDSRPKAVTKLERALRGFQVSGLINNIPFLVHCVRNKGFSEEQATTAFFEQQMGTILSKLNPEKTAGVVSESAAFCLAALVVNSKTSQLPGEGSVLSNSKFQPWHNTTGDWRLFGTAKRKINLHEGALSMDVVVESSVEGLTYHVVGSDKTINTVKTALKSIRKIDSGKGCEVFEISQVIGDKKRTATVASYVALNGNTVVDVWVEGETGDASTYSQFVVPKTSYTSGATASQNPVVSSPMPGKVIKIAVQQGQEVKTGDTLVIVEAMKMEHSILAPCDGIVSFFCEENASVNDGTVLAEITRPDKKK